MGARGDSQGSATARASALSESWGGFGSARCAAMLASLVAALQKRLSRSPGHLTLPAPRYE
jgi:hypothetical protein